MEKVGQANFVQDFRDLQDFLRNGWKVGRVSFFKSQSFPLILVVRRL